ISPAVLSTRQSAPSCTCQPAEMSCFLKLRQPAVVLPSNSSFHPALFSLADIVFTCGSEVAGFPVSAACWAATATAIATNTPALQHAHCIDFTVNLIYVALQSRCGILTEGYPISGP